jgi:AcrR family transcriptional regulator
VTQAQEHLPREERRRRTECAILEAAREQFAEAGFDRTTIRSVAAAAGVDPALVMQYHGNKERLFAAAAGNWLTERKKAGSVPLADIPAQALADLFEGFEDPAVRDSAAALLRNCLTYPAAAAIVRDDVLCETQHVVAAALGGEDAELRAGVMGACMMGLALARYLLEIPAVADASQEDLARVVEPALRAILYPPDA